VSIDTTNKLLKRLYDARDRIDLCALVPTLRKHYYLRMGSEEDRRVLDTFFTLFLDLYHANTPKLNALQTPGEAEMNLDLIVAQRSIANLVLLASRPHMSPADRQRFMKQSYRVKAIDTLAGQIVIQEGLRIGSGYRQEYVEYLLGEEVDAFLDMARGRTKVKELLIYIDDHGLPYGLAYSTIMGHNIASQYALFHSDDIHPRFRLCALLLLARANDVEESRIFHFIEGPDLLSLVKILIKHEIATTEDDGGSAEENEAALAILNQEIEDRNEERRNAPPRTLLSPADIDYWAGVAQGMLREDIYEDTGRLYACNIDAQIHMAARVLAAAGSADVDIVSSLRRLPEVLSFPNGSGHVLVECADGLLLLQDVSAASDSDSFFAETVAQCLVYRSA
jgi:hypothetical protein